MQLKLVLGLLCVSIHLNAQITFEKTFGFPFSEVSKSVHQTSDEGYIIGGTYLVKTDKYGVEEWNKPYRSNYTNLTADGGYILVYSSSPDMFFTKVDMNGDTLWKTHQRDGIWANEGNFISETSDGGFIVTGRYQSVTGSGMLLLKLNSQGNRVWRRAFSEPTSAGFNTGHSVQETSDGGYVLVGNAKIDYYDSTRNDDVFIIKTDSLGIESWRRFFGGAQNDVGYSVKQDAANNYLIAGTTYSYGVGTGSNMYLIKLDANGDSLWTKTYGGIFSETAIGLALTSDNGYMLSGSSETYTHGDLDGYMVKTDQNGDTLWTRHFGGVHEDFWNDVQETQDHGFVFAGGSSSMGAGGANMYVLKTDSMGNVQNPTSILDPTETTVTIHVFPNPTRGIVTFKAKQNFEGFTLVNVLGKIIYSSSGVTKNLTVDLSEQPIGIYYYRYDIENSTHVGSGMLIVNN